MNKINSTENTDESISISGDFKDFKESLGNNPIEKVSLVVSVYNEEAVLVKFYKEALPYLKNTGKKYEILFVNDGSIDSSRQILNDIAAGDKNVKVLHFSRNFGHEAAMIAGIDYADADALICMDADLQHPPSCIPMMIEKFDGGYDIISMIRTGNKSAGIIKNIASNGFYTVINILSDTKIEKSASDFFGISKRAAEILKKSYREKVRFLRGFVQNLGFNKTTLKYEAGIRAAGQSKYSIKKLFKFSINTILCFSDFPLKLGIYAGISAAVLGFIMMVYTIYSWASVGTPNGYATIIVLLCFMFAVLFVIVGIIGQYIGIIFSELKDRPIYIVEDIKNIE